jgi:hypothetical protein
MILPDVTKDQAETSVLFELIAARYERRSCARALDRGVSGLGVRNGHPPANGRSARRPEGGYRPMGDEGGEALPGRFRQAPRSI